MLPNTTLVRLRKIVWRFYHRAENRLQGTPYVRAKKRAYFAGQKIFLNFYLNQVNQKNIRSAVRRLRCFELGIDLIINNNHAPIKIIKKDGEKLLRFLGESKSGKKFCAQVLRTKRGTCYLISTFPYN